MRSKSHVVMDDMEMSTVRLRSLKGEVGLLKRADGSARLTQDGTRVLCAVYGPAEVKISKEQSDQYVIAMITCSSLSLLYIHTVTLQSYIRSDSKAPEWHVVPSRAVVGRISNQLLQKYYPRSAPPTHSSLTHSAS